jgi:hypothetical protein
MQFCLTITGSAVCDGYGTEPAQASGLGLGSTGFQPVNRRQKHLAVTITVNATTTGLHLLVDSIGIKMFCEGEWKTKKHGATTGGSGARWTWE